jgi:septal ring factor EnvC (AmiA/AmiB activator)
MWPKALSQLIELAPHITRLLPMADRFLLSKTASEEAARNAMEQMADGLRGDLGQVTAAHAGLYRQLNDQSEKLSAIASDLTSTRQSAEALESRLATLERQSRSQQAFLLIILLVLLAMCVPLAVLLLRHH